MPDEVTFIDLACLLRISPDTTLEKLGSIINASIFDASNIAGGLKQKGLIDFSAYYPGPNTIVITDIGKALMAEAETKPAEPFDDLDDAILTQLSGGKRIPADLQNTLHVRPKDLALRIYKLDKQGFLTYELKSGSADILLTASGFLKTKSPRMSKPQPEALLQQAQGGVSPNSNTAQVSNPEQAAVHDAAHKELENPKTAKGNAVLYLVILVVIIAVAFSALYYLRII